MVSKDLTPYLRFTTSTIVGSLPSVWSNGNIAHVLCIQGAKSLRYRVGADSLSGIPAQQDPRE